MTDTRELELVDGFLDSALVDAPMETDPDTLIETATRAHNALCYNHRHCFGSNPKSTLVGDLAMALTTLSDRVRVLEDEKATLREAILREAAAICKRIRLQSDLSEDERVGVLECALALTDEANVARAALAGGRE